MRIDTPPRFCSIRTAPVCDHFFPVKIVSNHCAHKAWLIEEYALIAKRGDVKFSICGKLIQLGNPSTLLPKIAVGRGLKTR